MAEKMVDQALESSCAAEVLDALSAVEAHLRTLMRDRADLMEHAVSIGVSQADLARRLEVSQAAVSRRMRQHHESGQDSRDRRVAVVIDAHERRQISTARLVKELVALGEGPMPALDRAIVRGTISPHVALEVEAAHLSRLAEAERLERMDPDLLDDLMQSHVKDAMVYLRDRDPQAHQELARRARHATSAAERIQLITESRAVLGDQGSNLRV